MTEAMTVSNETIASMTKCLLWSEISPPREKGTYKYGSKNFSKIMLFLESTDFSKEDLKYFMSLRVPREDWEDFETYKVRRRFIQQLEKFKKPIQAFYMMKAIEKFMKESKENKEKEQISDPIMEKYGYDYDLVNTKLQEVKESNTEILNNIK